MAKYQLASDGYDGVARSGVIRDDGKWVPAEAGNPDWYEYCEWLHESEDNNPEPFRSVANGGFEIQLEENQSAVGSMLDSVKDLDRELPPGTPRRIPERADIFMPPPVPTDASHSPARDQRPDASRPLSEEARKARQERAEYAQAHPQEEGVFTQTQQDDARRVHEDEARREGRAVGPSTTPSNAAQHQQSHDAMMQQRQEQNEAARKQEAEEAERRKDAVTERRSSEEARRGSEPARPSQPTAHTTRSEPDKRK